MIESKNPKITLRLVSKFFQKKIFFPKIQNFSRSKISRSIVESCKIQTFLISKIDFSGKNFETNKSSKRATSARIIRRRTPETIRANDRQESSDDGQSDALPQTNQSEARNQELNTSSEEEQNPDMNIVLSSSHSSLSAEDESHDEHGSEHSDKSRSEHIIRELITTEEIYIRELGEVLNGYGKEIDSIPPNKNCPEILRGNRYFFKAKVNGPKG